VKRIRNSRAARILSWVLTVAMLTPVLMGLTPQAAYAQQGTPTTAGNLLTVIVNDFTNLDKNHTGGEALARYATDAVAVELAQSARFEVLKREEVARAANELGYRAPFDNVQLAKIAQNLGAAAIVSGEIAYVRTDEGNKTGPIHQVNVGLKVRIRDVSSGELLNGAAEIGQAYAKPGQTDLESLAQEAVSKAAVSSVRSILAFSLPEGIVTNSITNTSGSTVLINRGSRDGIEAGMEMLVLRNGQRVGKIRVTNVFATDSEGRVTENLVGVAPQDTVRATFPEREFTSHGEIVKPKKTTSGSTISTLGKILLVVVIGVVIATAIKQGGSVTGVTAEAETQNAAPAVRLTWRDNLFGGGTLEYHIWRMPDQPFNVTGIPVAAVGGGVRQYTDFPAPFSYWDGTRSFLQVAINGGNNGGGNNGGGNGTAASTTPVAGAVPGFIIGRTSTYSVTGVVRRNVATTGNNNGGGGGGNNGNSFEDVESLPVNSGPTTPINQPQQSTPADASQQLNLASLTNFTFLTPAQGGADQYVLEYSTDRTFMDRSRIVQIQQVSTVNGTVTFPPVDLTNSGLNAPLRKDPVFANFVNRVPGAARPTIFWRIGARNSQDSPGPVHAITRNPKDEDRTFRYIYSSVRSFTPADMPPPPP
jgi:curli biogenesis system outer membrane secretion channel CsgG